MPRIANLPFSGMAAPEAARAGAVKVSRRSDLDPCCVVDRLYLDGAEPDAMLETRLIDLAARAVWHVAAGVTALRYLVEGALASPTEHERMCYLPAPDL